MTALAMAMASGRRSPITVSANWGATSGTTATITSPNVTLTVPASNSGTLKFDITTDSGPTTHKYSKNGGAFTSYADLAEVTFANGDTLKFDIESSGAGHQLILSVIDKDTNTTVGTCTLTNRS